MARKRRRAGEKERRQLRDVRDQIAELDAQREDLAEARNLLIRKLVARYSESQTAKDAGVHPSWVSKIKKKKKVPTR